MKLGITIKSPQSHSVVGNMKKALKNTRTKICTWNPLTKHHSFTNITERPENVKVKRT